MRSIYIKNGLREPSFLLSNLVEEEFGANTEFRFSEEEGAQQLSIPSDDARATFLYTPKQALAEYYAKRGSQVNIFCDHFYSAPSTSLSKHSNIQYFCLNSYWNTALLQKGFNSKIYYWDFKNSKTCETVSNTILVPAINLSCYGLLDKFLFLTLKFVERKNSVVTLACVLSQLDRGLKKQLKQWKNKVSLLPLKNTEDLLTAYDQNDIILYPGTQTVLGVSLKLALIKQKKLLAPYSDVIKSIAGDSGKYIKCQRDKNDNLVYNKDFEQAFFGELGRLLTTERGV